MIEIVLFDYCSNKILRKIELPYIPRANEVLADVTRQEEIHVKNVNYNIKNDRLEEIYLVIEVHKNPFSN